MRQYLQPVKKKPRKKYIKQPSLCRRCLDTLAINRYCDKCERVINGDIEEDRRQELKEEKEHYADYSDQ